jgi:hypothetical protein
MEYILGRSAGKTKIRSTFKEEDEHRWEEAVVSIKDDMETTTTMGTTTVVLETNISLKTKTNRRISTKTLNQTHQIKWLCIHQIPIPA